MTSQKDKFKEVARELGCDEDEEAFRRKPKKIAQAPVSEKPKSKKPNKTAQQLAPSRLRLLQDIIDSCYHAPTAILRAFARDIIPEIPIG